MEAISVGDVTKYIKNLFERDEKLASLWVRGELSNFKRHTSGHCYFVLKDSQAAIRCVMFKSRAQYLKFEPKDGMQVTVLGQITVFERDGQYQFYIERLIPEGAGEIGAAFEQLKEKLKKEGLFDATHKKKLPFLPRAVGVITSPTGAAVRDIFTVSKRRYQGLPLILCPVQVQGAEAAGQIARAIENFNKLNIADVLIVGRGGGSLEDLWAFNEEVTVRAIAASKIPVVSAVGHETDFTLADFAADQRAATPSQAAEIVTPDREELERYLKVLVNSLAVNVKRQLKSRQESLARLSASYTLSRPDKLLASKRQELDAWIENLQKAARQNFRQKAQTLELAAAKINMLSPLSNLARGYSIVQTPAGETIKNAAEVQIGENLAVILQKGRLEVQVTEAQKEGNSIG
ncbi:MAG: exodeoxyribonuclease VII large subunit [Sporomusaceae bacterium]|nr:exodeoxyribonuclease VII large subunit [Sporomusaceae bacterium]